MTANENHPKSFAIVSPKSKEARANPKIIVPLISKLSSFNPIFDFSNLKIPIIMRMIPIGIFIIKILLQLKDWSKNPPRQVQ